MICEEIRSLCSPEIIDFKSFYRLWQRNKGIKLTDRRIKGIVRDKINNKSTKWIAWEWKVSEATVKRVWIYWLKNHELLPIKRAGRRKTVLDEYEVNLIIELHK